jgi:hypothetical protein
VPGNSLSRSILGQNLEELYFAEATALFHDIGRFEQYKRYGTFRFVIEIIRKTIPNVSPLLVWIYPTDGNIGFRVGQSACLPSGKL